MNAKRRIKAGLYFGICMTFFLSINYFHEHNPASTPEIIKALVIGLLGGISCGILFGWSAGLLIKPKPTMNTGRILLNPGENLLFESAANQFKGLKTLHGQLYLTNQRLVFNYHKSNGTMAGSSIDLTTIESVNQYRILGIVNKGLSIVTNQETTLRFEVMQVEVWHKLLKSRQRNHLTSSAN